MSRDNWERLVVAVLRNEELREIALAPSMDPSDVSSRLSFTSVCSDLNSSFRFSSPPPEHMPVSAPQELSLLTIMAEPEKKTVMVLNVDLQCHCCSKKIQKILCRIPQIRDILFDEKANTVTISVTHCSPEKIRDKLGSKGGKITKSIEIKKPPTHKPDSNGNGNEPPPNNPAPGPPVGRPPVYPGNRCRGHSYGCFGGGP